MIDLDKPSHRQFAQTFYSRIVHPRLTPRRRCLYLDLANDEELRGNYHGADELRRFALKHPSRSAASSA